MLHIQMDGTPCFLHPLFLFLCSQLFHFILFFIHNSLYCARRHPELSCSFPHISTGCIKGPNLFSRPVVKFLARLCHYIHTASPYKVWINSPHKANASSNNAICSMPSDRLFSSCGSPLTRARAISTYSSSRSIPT